MATEALERGSAARTNGSESNDVTLDDVQALILAGGTGTRLRPLVSDRPKPMASVGETPFLELQLRWLREHGVKRFIFCVGYLHEQIRSHFGDGSRWNVEVDYSVEETLLGTGGALKQAERRVDGPFLALNGDSFLEFDPTPLVRFHRETKARHPRCLGTLALTLVPDARAFGSVELDRAGRILSFEEKNELAAGPGLINAGVYVLEPGLLTAIDSDRKVSLERETFPSVLKHGFQLFAYKAEGFFADIGTPPGYRRFERYVEQKRSQA
jgi:NDP-sugar pyrophosphorylase family protein